MSKYNPVPAKSKQGKPVVRLHRPHAATVSYTSRVYLWFRNPGERMYRPLGGRGTCTTDAMPFDDVGQAQTSTYDWPEGVRVNAYLSNGRIVESWTT